MENTIEKKLNALLELQNIDRALDQLTKLRGALPEEVEDLEAESDSLKTHSQRIQEELAELEQAITTQRGRIKDLETLVKRYEEQQMNVRNNREYDAITKEIDLQKLEIQLAEKHIKTAYENIDKKKLELEQNQAAIEKTQQVLADKQEELQVLVAESEGEAKKLHGQRSKVLKRIDGPLQKTYERIRANFHNKLAVVTIIKEACGGCFNKVPPQKQIDIKEKKSITVCEHCGRIIADVTEPEPVIAS
ncbi:MAG: C4-type zinc ribbon domain-containing protein [Bacteroidota bacterium]